MTDARYVMFSVGSQLLRNRPEPELRPNFKGRNLERDSEFQIRHYPTKGSLAMIIVKLLCFSYASLLVKHA